MNYLFCLLLLAGGTQVVGRTIVVDMSGQGNYTAIGAAAAASAPGDTVLVKNGAYNERVTVTISGTTGHPVTFRAENRHQAKMQGFMLIADYISIEGFEITGTAAEGVTNRRSHNRITDNFLHDITNTGVESGTYGYVAHNSMNRVLTGIDIKSNSLVEHNRIVGLINTGYGFTVFTGDSIIIRNNYFWNDTLVAYFFNTADWMGAPVHDLLVENNICFNTKHASEPDASNLQSSARLTYRNNLFVNAYVVGICTRYCRQVKVLNNTFINCGAYPVWLQDSQESGDVVKNNVIAYYDYDKINASGGPALDRGVRADGQFPPDCDYNIYWGTQMYSTPGPHERIVSPQFVNPQPNDTLAADFRLLATSPLIDAGINMGLATDIMGTPRPQGAAYDIGAYEAAWPNAPTNLTAGQSTAHTITLGWTAPPVAPDNNPAVVYIIKRNGVQVGTSTTTAFTDSNLTESTTYDYQVFAVNILQLVSVTAATGSFATIADAVGPVVVQVVSLGLTQVQILFDEPVDQATSEAANSYQLSGGITVLSAVRQADGKSVVVTTSQQTEGSQYTITISNVQDASVAKNTMTSAQKQFTAMFKFEDNFESGTMSKWTPSTSSVWTVVNDGAGNKSLFIGAAVPAERLLVNRTYNLLSFDADLKGYGTSAYRNLSIIIGLQDTSNYYHINFAGAASTAYNGIFKVMNKVESRIATGAATLTETAAYHHVRVTWNGATGEIKAFFNQSYVPAFTAVDTTYRSGKCGVWSKTSKQGYIDNVKVVSYLRADNFGTPSGISPALPQMATAGAVYPNPMKMSSLGHYFSGTTHVKLYDLQGNPVRCENIKDNGIYLIQEDGEANISKITILKQ